VSTTPICCSTLGAEPVGGIPLSWAPRVLTHKLTPGFRIFDEKRPSPRPNEILWWQNDPSLLIANRAISSSGDAKRRKRTDDCGTVVMVRDGFEDIDETSIGKQITDQTC
jgi:hypothetical protein